MLIASDIHEASNFHGLLRYCDATDRNQIQKVVTKHAIPQVIIWRHFNLPRERQILWPTWDINMNMLVQCLGSSRISGMDKVFFPKFHCRFWGRCPADNTAYNANLTCNCYGMSKPPEKTGHSIIITWNMDGMVRSIPLSRKLWLHNPCQAVYYRLRCGYFFTRRYWTEEFSCFLERYYTTPCFYGGRYKSHHKNRWRQPKKKELPFDIV